MYGAYILWVYFVSSHGMKYIILLWLIVCRSGWKKLRFPTIEVKVSPHSSKRICFSSFGTPREIIRMDVPTFVISCSGLYMRNMASHSVASLYHPKSSSGKVKESNREIKQILPKTVLIEFIGQGTRLSTFKTGLFLVTKVFPYGVVDL